MQIHILAFGIAKEIVGGSELSFDLTRGNTVSHLKEQLMATFPDFDRLASLAIAVNGEYVADDRELAPSDEVVIIPPVSGG